MAYIANTMFEVTVSNSVHNQTQNVPGKFGTYADSTFTPDDCAAGFLCTKAALIPSEGYEGVTVNGAPILNGNTWYFVAATNGASAGYGDHTGIYAFNNYDVNKAVSGSNQWNVGANTLGLGLPSGNRGDFCELIVGEQYTFGVGNFTAAPEAGEIYATLANGLWTATDTLPVGGTGVYAEILRTKPVNEGTSYWGNGYVLVIKRTAEAAPAA